MGGGCGDLEEKILSRPASDLCLLLNPFEVVFKKTRILQRYNREVLCACHYEYSNELGFLEVGQLEPNSALPAYSTLP